MAGALQGVGMTRVLKREASKAPDAVVLLTTPPEPRTGSMSRIASSSRGFHAKGCSSPGLVCDSR